MLTKWLGTEAWITNLDLLTGLRQYASDPILQKEWNVVSPLSFLRNWGITECQESKCNGVIFSVDFYVVWVPNG
jgi:hypothetical protein